MGDRRVVAMLVLLMASIVTLVGVASNSVLTANAGVANGDPALNRAAADPGAVQLTSAEKSQWAALTATPFERAKVVAELQKAFSGVAQVGTGPLPKHGPNGPLTPATSPSNGSSNAELMLAAGVSGNHFWITASYHDIADGAIWGGVIACDRYLPSEMCLTAGELLIDWSYGWGYGNTHGVWAAIYWWPPHIAGGRW